MLRVELVVEVAAAVMVALGLAVTVAELQTAASDLVLEMVVGLADQGKSDPAVID